MKHVKLKHEYQGQSTQKTLYNNKINLLTEIMSCKTDQALISI